MSGYYDEVVRPVVKRHCVICARVGAKYGWSEREMLVGPRGTAHHAKGEWGADSTVCGLDATGDGWWWPL